MGEIQYPYEKRTIIPTSVLCPEFITKLDDQVEGVTERVGGTWTDATRPTPSDGVPHPIGWNTDRGCYEHHDGTKWCELPSASQAPSIVFSCAESLAVKDWVAASTVADEVVKAAADSLATAAIGVVSGKPSPTQARVLLAGVLSGFSGLSPRDRIFLSTTPGAHLVNPNFNPIPPEFKIIQELGVAVSTTTIVVALSHTIQIE